MVGFRFATLPRWLNWVVALIVVAMLGMAPYGPGLAAILGLGWIALLSLALFVWAWRDGRGPSPPAAGRAQGALAR